MQNKFCLLSNDVETTSIWFNCLSPETGYKVYMEGMPELLDLYAKFNIKSTFFFCGDIVKLYPDIVKMILPYNHEVASHGWSHEVNQAFDILSLKEQILQLEMSKKTLEDISGQEVISFRAPALRINKFTGMALRETGFKIDSSVASQRFDMFMSFGGIKKLNWLIAPRLPYKTSESSLFRKGKSSIVEVPLTAFGMPFTSTTMRLFPLITQFQKRLSDFEYSFHKKPVVFDIHPNELIVECDKPRLISRRSNTILGYWIKDILRAKLKTKNLGSNTMVLYTELISYYKKEGYNFITIKDYVNKIQSEL